MDGQRAAVETVPRQPSYVFAPADPLLMSYARSWSLSEPYLIKPKQVAAEPEAAGSGRGGSLPLQAVEARTGAVISMGPELPSFLQRTA